jgi:hypothetical protein
MGRRMAAIAMLVVFFMPAASLARQPITNYERAQITRATHTDYPARCSRVWISTADRRWALWEVPSQRAPHCPLPPGNGYILLHRTAAGQWRIDTEGDIGSCSLGRPVPRLHQPRIPARVARDLRC